MLVPEECQDDIWLADVAQGCDLTKRLGCRRQLCQIRRCTSAIVDDRIAVACDEIRAGIDRWQAKKGC